MFSNDPILPINERGLPEGDGLRLLSLNICHLPNKRDQLCSMIANNSKPIHIIGISESRCPSIMPDEQIAINGYKLFRSNPTEEQKDEKEKKEPLIIRTGLALYIDNNIKHHRRKDLERKHRMYLDANKCQ